MSKEAEPESPDSSIDPIQCDPKFRIEMLLLLPMSGMGGRIPDCGDTTDRASKIRRGWTSRYSSPQIL
jgi:hypothetical protein